jgi:hypothetical protein
LLLSQKETISYFLDKVTHGREASWFYNCKAKKRKVGLNAALQNEEKLNTLRLGLLQI